MPQVSGNFDFRYFPADIDKTAVAYAGWAGGFTGTAGQTTIQVKLRLGTDCPTFEQLFDQVNATAGSVQFITEELVGGTGGGTKTTVYTGTQDVIGLFA